MTNFDVELVCSICVVESNNSDKCSVSCARLGWLFGGHHCRNIIAFSTKPQQPHASHSDSSGTAAVASNSLARLAQSHPKKPAQDPAIGCMPREHSKPEPAKHKQMRTDARLWRIRTFPTERSHGISCGRWELSVLGRSSTQNSMRIARLAHSSRLTNRSLHRAQTHRSAFRSAVARNAWRSLRRPHRRCA